MKIEINTEVLIANNLTANELLILSILYNRKDDLLKELASNVHYLMALTELKRKEFIMVTGQISRNMSLNDILISEKAMRLVNKKTKAAFKREVALWIDEYRSLFPKGLNNNHHPYKGSKKGCIDKMASFVMSNPNFSKELILKVTKNYITEKAKDNYAYMSEAHYFIEKNNVSPMEGLCEAQAAGDITANGGDSSPSGKSKFFSI